MRYHELFENNVPSLIKSIPEELKQLRKAFVKANRDIRFVGGCVRDSLLGKKPKDIDLCTDATPDEQIQIYQSNDYHFIPTGLQHGTITVVLNDEGYEITSLRTETEHDGRHATVAYTRDWVEDLSRRDLTINAMAMTFDGELIDPFNGADDLKAGTVQFVGNPEDRMTEDYLRILRYFRFNGRLGTSFDENTEHAIAKCAAGLHKISGERIWMEMSKIIVGPNATQQVHKMYQLGVTKNIGLPGVPFMKGLNNFHGGNPITALAFMIDRRTADALNDYWKFSSHEYKMLCWLIDNRSSTFTLSKGQDFIVDGISPEWVAQLAILYGKKELVDQLRIWQAPMFPVNGADLQAKGIKPGPEMGKILKDLKTKWKNSRYKLSKQELLNSV